MVFFLSGFNNTTMRPWEFRERIGADHGLWKWVRRPWLSLSMYPYGGVPHMGNPLASWFVYFTEHPTNIYKNNDSGVPPWRKPPSSSWLLERLEPIPPTPQLVRWFKGIHIPVHIPSFWLPLKKGWFIEKKVSHPNCRWSIPVLGAFFSLLTRVLTYCNPWHWDEEIRSRSLVASRVVCPRIWWQKVAQSMGLSSSLRTLHA